MGVLVLNPDLILEAGAIAELAEALRDPAVGVAVPMILDSAGGWSSRCGASRR